MQTDLIHFSPFDPLNSRPLNPPIFQTATFYFKNLEQVENLFSLKEKNFIYTRGGNPTVNLLEQRLAKIEHGADAVCFSSGIGAISTTLISLLKSGDSILVSDTLYGSSMGFIQNILGKFKVKIVVADLSNGQELAKLFSKNHFAVVYLETPCNPSLKLIDIKLVAKFAHKQQAKVVVDNTFATPLFQQPLNLGADVVIHSLTKYLNGHGDALGGVAISKDQAYIDTLKFMYMCDIGTVLDPNSAFLILRGLKTFAIRMKQHEQNALAVAKFLEKHEQVIKVIYPGLDSFPQQELKNKQMSGNGAIISIYLKQDVQQFLQKLKLFKLAVSLGDTESLVEYPLYMTHRHYLQHQDSQVYKELKPLIRLSIGLEDATDLIADLKNALA